MILRGLFVESPPSFFLFIDIFNNVLYNKFIHLKQEKLL